MELVPASTTQMPVVLHVQTVKPLMVTAGVMQTATDLVTAVQMPTVLSVIAIAEVTH